MLVLKLEETLKKKKKKKINNFIFLNYKKFNMENLNIEIPKNRAFSIFQSFQWL
jgi:hypothetical protein